MVHWRLARAAWNRPGCDLAPKAARATCNVALLIGLSLILAVIWMCFCKNSSVIFVLLLFKKQTWFEMSVGTHHFGHLTFPPSRSKRITVYVCRFCINKQHYMARCLRAFCDYFYKFTLGLFCNSWIDFHD